MYWPNGVPRVYAVNGPNIVAVTSDDREPPIGTAPVDQESSLGENEDSNGNSEASPVGQNKPKNDGPSSHTEMPRWENEAIHGLCVSRSGHMFATITESSISLWQTRVCLEQPAFRATQQHVNRN